MKHHDRTEALPACRHGMHAGHTVRKRNDSIDAGDRITLFAMDRSTR